MCWHRPLRPAVRDRNRQISMNCRFCEVGQPTWHSHSETSCQQKKKKKSIKLRNYKSGVFRSPMPRNYHNKNYYWRHWDLTKMFIQGHLLNNFCTFSDWYHSCYCSPSPRISPSHFTLTVFPLPLPLRNVLSLQWYTSCHLVALHYLSFFIFALLFLAETGSQVS